MNSLAKAEQNLGRINNLYDQFVMQYARLEGEINNTLQELKNRKS